MMKAAEDLKQQQLLKEQERQRILTQRIIPLPNVDEIEDHGEERIHCRFRTLSYVEKCICSFIVRICSKIGRNLQQSLRAHGQIRRREI